MPDERMIPIALASVRAAASYFFKDETTLERIALSVEEAITNVTAYCLTDSLEKIAIETDLQDAAFVVTITDRGLPGDFGKELTEEKGLGLSIMHRHQ